jgi:hypothetical protein
MWSCRCNENGCEERIRLCVIQPCAKVHSAYGFPWAIRVRLGANLGPSNATLTSFWYIYKDHQGHRPDSLHDSCLSRFWKTQVTLLPLSIWSCGKRCYLVSAFLPHRNGFNVVGGFFIDLDGRTSLSKFDTASQDVLSSPVSPYPRGIGSFSCFFV